MKRVLSVVIVFTLLMINLALLNVSAKALVDNAFPQEVVDVIFSITPEPDPVINNGREFVYYKDYVFYAKDEQLWRLNLNTKELLILDDMRKGEYDFGLDSKIFIYNDCVYYQAKSAEDGIYKINIDGTNKARVTDGLINYFDATRGILFSHTFYGGINTYVTFLNEGSRYDIGETHFNILRISDQYIVYSERRDNGDPIKIYSIRLGTSAPVLIAEYDTYTRENLNDGEVFKYGDFTKAQIVGDDLFYNIVLTRDGRYLFSQLFKTKLDGSSIAMIEEIGASTFFIKDGYLYFGYADLGLGGAYKMPVSGGNAERANTQSIYGDFVFGNYQYLPRLTVNHYSVGNEIERFDFNTDYENKQTIVSIDGSENLLRAVDKITVIDDWVYFVTENTQYGWGYESGGRYIGWQFYRVKTDGTNLELLEKSLEILVSIDGYYMPYDDFTISFIEDNQVLIPFRRAFDALGAAVDWDGDTKVIAEKGDVKITLSIGSNIMNVNGREIALDVPAKLINERTFVPIRAVYEALGCNVEWDEDNQTVIIKQTSQYTK